MGAAETTDGTPPSSGVLAHIKHAAQYLGLSQYQVQNLIDDGRLAAEKINNRTYIKVEDLAEYVDTFGKSA